MTTIPRRPPPWDFDPTMPIDRHGNTLGGFKFFGPPLSPLEKSFDEVVSKLLRGEAPGEQACRRALLDMLAWLAANFDPWDWPGSLKRIDAKFATLDTTTLERARSSRTEYRRAAILSVAVNAWGDDDVDGAIHDFKTAKAEARRKAKRQADATRRKVRKVRVP